MYKLRSILSSIGFLKVLIAGLCAAVLIIWSTSAQQAGSETTTDITRGAIPQDEQYVGSDACKDCHEDQFKNFSHTAHAQLETLGSWKGKVTGCEQCHGPGKAHIQEGDKTKILSFTNKSPKAISETCLTCHAGKDEHNNFRRGEHWRNDVGCSDCHSSHSPEPTTGNPGSNTFVSESARRNNDTLVANMLRKSEPQMCLSCHAEMKAQFNMPFHHRVLEGTMKCTDCHNAHGGFELKQTKLSVGADSGCLKCHVDKQGPFVFEHAPLKIDGCAICHSPHGSANPKLLVRSQIRQLCLECHSNVGEIGAPNTPSFHNQATIRFQNCTTCHVKIHGSQIDPTFFR